FSISRRSIPSSSGASIKESPCLSSPGLIPMQNWRRKPSKITCMIPLAAIEAVEKQTGEKQINVIGYCVGGTLLALTLAYLAAKKMDQVLSATFFASQVDFTFAGDLKVFIDEERVSALERKMQEHGFLDASKMATVFNMLRSNDLIWLTS